MAKVSTEKQDFRTFPTYMHMLQFFGSYLPKLDLAKSFRLPTFGYYYDEKVKINYSLPEFLTNIDEYANLGISKASVQRGTFFILFFDKPLRNPKTIGTQEEDEVNNAAELFAEKIKEPLIGGLDNAVAVNVEVKDDGVDETEVSVEKTPEIDLVSKAKALYNEADKRGSKADLEAFGKEHGVTLNKGKTFDGMIEEFVAALEVSGK